MKIQEIHGICLILLLLIELNAVKDHDNMACIYGLYGILENVDEVEVKQFFGFSLWLREQEKQRERYT